MAEKTAETGTRARILQAAYKLFYRQGFSRVSMDAIAEAAGVTKRTVYYHFASKDDVVAEVLGAQQGHLMRQFEGWLPACPDGPAPAKLEALFGELLRWAEAPHWLGSGFTRITTELADMPGHPARKAARHHKATVEAWLADELGDAGLARQVMVLLEGAMSLTLIHGSTDYIRSARDAALALVP